ncbi:heavy-metal-associated domain-containing protein [Nesterenkonia flava]|uniref:Heavy metal-associated domain-containing protein n=1 Tax=Nesterenkonia flava TaxID=469799 RepID=A0ABU1FWP7_9MICC|nr:heavy metal-associated domain-containing protein [Nesterenkonia flava]MDR5713099.1 heavy metal-associated domain-containing protein [Nesterenkonia flava]
MHTSEFLVQGMSCGGCEASVRKAVSQLPAVSDVQVSAQSGRLALSAEEPIDDTAVLAAIDTAGYRAATI